MSVVQLFLEHEARAAGYELDDLVATIRPGRIPSAEREAYDKLAAFVHHLRRQGVTLRAIGDAIGKSRQTVLRLASRGLATSKL